MQSHDLSEEHLRNLLSQKMETSNLDYKEFFDYSSRGKQDRVRLSKDIMAMANNPEGGYLVLGVRDKSFDPVGLPYDYALDQAILQDKVAPYPNRQISIHYVQHKIKTVLSDDISPRQRLFGLIYVEPSVEPVIAATDGTVVLENGKQELAFSCGDIIVRRGTQSTKANDEDISKLYEYVRKSDKDKSWQEWKSQLTGLVDELISQGIFTRGTKLEIDKQSEEWHNLPRPDFEKFIGRASYISQVLDSLLHSRAWIVSIDGVGGVGKTALALHVANLCWDNKNFDLVVWTSAKSTRLSLSGIDQFVPSVTSLESLLDEIVSIVFPEIKSASFDEKRQEVKWILKNAKTLLIVDNLETIADTSVFEFLRDLPEPSKALVTSRHRIGQGERVIRLEGFDEKEALSFIRYEAERVGAKMLLKASLDKQQEIIQGTGGIPLAIKWIVGQVSLGRTVSEATKRIALAGSAPLEFCFSDTYKILSEPAKILLMSMPLFENPVRIGEFIAATGLSVKDVENGLSELVKVSMFNVDTSMGDLPVFTTLPLTRYFAQSLLDRGSQSTMLKKLSEYYQHAEVLEKVKEQATELFEIVGASTERGQTAAILSQVAFGNYQRGKYEEALKLFEQAVRINPKLSFTYQTWASVEWQEGNYSRARELWQEAARLNPNNSLIWRSWGFMEKELRNFYKARKCFEEAVRVNDKDRVAWHALGFEQSKNGDLEEAERSFLKALYSNPKTETECHHNVVSYHSLSVTMRKKRDYINALKYCRKGLQLDPTNSRLLSLQDQLD